MFFAAYVQLIQSGSRTSPFPCFWIHNLFNLLLGHKRSPEVVPNTLSQTSAFKKAQNSSFMSQLTHINFEIYVFCKLQN